MQWGTYSATPAATSALLQGLESAVGSNAQLVCQQGTEWVSNRIYKRALNRSVSRGQQGFKAEYWNNPNREGSADVVTLEQNPFHFCTAGATVFAPGVELTGFSARYTSTFEASQSGEVYFHFYINGATELKIDGKSVFEYLSKHG